MRQLKISKQHAAPAWETDRAQAIPFLQGLAAAQPLGLAAEAEEKLLRFIVAVATLCWGRGVAWEALLRSGYAGAVHCYAACAEPDRWVGWWVRQKIVATNA